MLNHLGSRRFLSGAAALFLLIAINAGFPAKAQRSTDIAPNDLQLHKFEPKVAPELAAKSAPISDMAVGANGISHFASAQMQALQQEKDSRTPAQQKIDSNVLYTLRMLQGQDAAPGVSYLYTGVTLDANDSIVVDMVANVTDSLLSKLSAAGASVLYSNASMRSIRAIIAPDKIEGIAASPDVIFISPKQEAIHSGNLLPQNSAAANWKLSPVFAARIAKVRQMIAKAQALHPNTPGTGVGGQGSVETEGDTTHQAAVARGQYGITGAGLKIGVLSDGVMNVALSQGTGDIPPTCGSGVPSPCLTVIQNGPSGDEGTAMLEIIHDMAPELTCTLPPPISARPALRRTSLPCGPRAATSLWMTSSISTNPHFRTARSHRPSTVSWPLAHTIFLRPATRGT